MTPLPIEHLVLAVIKYINGSLQPCGEEEETHREQLADSTELRVNHLDEDELYPTS